MEQFNRQELQASTINESDHLLQVSTYPSKYPTITTLNEITIGDSSPSDAQSEPNVNKQHDSNSDSINSFKTTF